MGDHRRRRQVFLYAPRHQLFAHYQSRVCRHTTGRKAQGASTLTQQFVKNAILTNEKKHRAKIKRSYPVSSNRKNLQKDQILQLYFNEIPYGSTLYGIESASQSYFGKQAKDLTLDEAALLAALPHKLRTLFSLWNRVEGGQ